MLKIKRRGPRIEPWGTGNVLDGDLLMVMNWWRLVRDDFNQERAVLVILREDSRQVRRVE